MDDQTQVEGISLNNEIDLNDIREENQGDILDKYLPVEPSDGEFETPAEPEPQPIKLEDLPLEERKQRINLLNALKSYKLSSFRDILAEYDQATFALRSNEELAELLEEFRFLVNIRNSNTFNMSVFQNMSIVAETGLQKFGLKCAGLSQQLSVNKDIPLLVEEIGLAHQHLSHMRPEFKLGLIIFSTASLMHQMNSAREELKQKTEVKAKESLKEEFKDI